MKEKGVERVCCVGNFSIPYTLLFSKKSRYLRLTVHSDGKLIVTTPKRFSFDDIESYIFKKRDWVIERITHVKNNPKLITTVHTKAEVIVYKKKALEYVCSRLEYWNTFYALAYKNVAIKNTKTRWGSCSSKGNLNFNYKIIFLPQELADYIVVHELCHLKEMNHSKNFWNLVTKTIPHYKELRQQLKIV